MILLTAHLDHLGDRAKGADTIYNGADDDASGTIAVLELARGAGARTAAEAYDRLRLVRQRRAGRLRIRLLPRSSTVPLDADRREPEFEMIGRPDAAVAPHTLWLTG